ncbi:MAG TPA: NAD(P)H-dependent oxidoreductase [Steroidobacteraceae bacterium]|nr:NAD(P)H-dependent oxidoreductase [Steroidobacteraceae bacterium]
MTGTSTLQPPNASFGAVRSTIALFSSSRRLGNTGQLIDRVARQLNIEVIDIARLRISSYDYDHSNRHDDFEPLMRHVLAHDQIIFASPIYWYAVSPAMKAFIDRLSDLLELPDLLAEGRRLRGKNAYVACTSTGDEPSAQFMGAFRETFAYLGMHFGGAVHINCQGGYLPAVHDPEALKFAALVSEGLRGARLP